MLKKVLRAIVSGCSSASEISEKTGMQESAAAAAMNLLAAKGHLRAECGACPGNVSRCTGCPASKGRSASASGFSVTRKGTEYAKA